MQETSWKPSCMRLFLFSEVHILRFLNCSLPEYIRQLRLFRRRSSRLLQPADSSSTDMGFQQSFLHSCQMRFHLHFLVSDLGYPASLKLKAVQLNRRKPYWKYPLHHQISDINRPWLSIPLCIPWQSAQICLLHSYRNYLQQRQTLRPGLKLHPLIPP